MHIIVFCRYTTMRAVRGNATVKLDIISPTKGQKFKPIVRKLDYVSINTSVKNMFG